MNQNIIIGCGGAGLKTLAELNRMLAQTDRVSQLHDEVFYLAVDTCETELGHFADEIAKQMGPHTPPHVELVCLSHGVEVFADAFHEPFVARYSKCPQDAGLARLKEHWWFDANGVPFMANGIQHLSSGACIPQVAYGLAWYHLGDIESAIKRIMDKMLLRGKQPHVTLRIVAGLAGGTGRGAWALTAFKVREVLRNHYRQNVHSEGFFFDASVYDNVGRACKNMDITMKVNALTGLSELSGWLENVNGGTVMYRLPSLATPERETTDALVVDIENDPTSGFPVERAYLICGHSRWAKLSDNNQYYRMAGEALSAIIDNPEIAAKNRNSLEVYHSLSASVFEVDRVHIQAYCETLAKETVLDELSRSEDGAAEAVQAFFAEYPLAEHIPMEMELEPNETGTLWERLAYEVLATCELEFKVAHEGLRRWTLEESVERVSRLIQPLSHDEIHSALKRALLGFGPLRNEGKLIGLGGKTVETAVVAWAKRTFLGTESQSAASLGRALKALKLLRDKMGTAWMAISSSPKMSTSVVAFEEPRATVEKTLRAYSKRSFRKMFLAKGHYEDAELAVLLQRGPHGVYSGVIPRGVLLANWEGIQSVVREEFTPVLKRIEKLIVRCEALIQCCYKVRDVFRREEGVAAGGREDEDGFSRLFAVPDRVEDTLCAPDSSSRIVHRTLMPIVDHRGEVVEELRNSVHIGHELPDFIGSVLAETRDEIEWGEARKSFWGELLEAVRENVCLSNDFMARHFSFQRVLARNLPHWNRALAVALGKPLRFNDLLKRFFVTLGTRKEDFDGRWADEPPTLPDIDILLGIIATSLAAACVPWWVADTGDAKSKLTLFLPFELRASGRNSRAWLEAMIRDMVPHADAEIFGQENRGEWLTSCYSMVAFASEEIRLAKAAHERGSHPLDKVTALDYHKEPVVREWLRLAESKSGDSIFSANDGNLGMGYLSPVFVRNKTLSESRWKPWGRGGIDLPPPMSVADSSLPVKTKESEDVSVDVFISYRRESGRDIARTLQQALKARGYSVFFDYDSLRDGVFNQAIYKAIENCRVFVAFLSKGSLDRCSATEDWVRAELEYALQKGKKIVPIAATETLSGWHWPSGLPQSLAPLKGIQISELHTGGLFEESLDKLLRERFPKARGNQEGCEEC